MTISEEEVIRVYGKRWDIGVDSMKIIKREKKLCLVCMEEHEVDIVEVVETEIFKDEEVTFTATYEYCPIGDEFLETEEMIRSNSLAMKDAYIIMYPDKI